MKILILGGTRFLGRHLVEALAARGHEITLFNRGQSNAALFPQLESLRGDREGNLMALEGRCWDTAIDTYGYLPRLVGASAALLARSVERYVFISSISVYPNPEIPGLNEDSPPGRLADPSVEEITEETYGPLKALCEEVVEKSFPARALIVRPGLIVGPHDPSDRFTYWPSRIALGGEVLAPGEPERQVQFIDARDLAAWITLMVEKKETGVYNATGPAEKLTMRETLEACRAACGKDSNFHWVGEEFLAEQGITAYRGKNEDPFWLPERTAGMMAVDCSRAIARGLTFRPLSRTVQDTLAWDQKRSPKGTWLISSEKEAQLLSSWNRL
ncbi:MAG TPA: epimerase [Cyanobacteria bacterium UBA8530]|nr:epimerase [Cyanobacteria bacterium UBA8530]